MRTSAQRRKTEKTHETDPKPNQHYVKNANSNANGNGIRNKKIENLNKNATRREEVLELDGIRSDQDPQNSINKIIKSIIETWTDGI